MTYMKKYEINTTANTMTPSGVNTVALQTDMFSSK